MSLLKKNPQKKKQQPQNPLPVDTYYSIYSISMTFLVTKEPLSRLFQTSGLLKISVCN